MNRWWLHLLPELRQFGPDERDAALRTARDEEPDLFELIGALLGLLAVAALTNAMLVDHGAGARGAVVLLNFLIALPLLALAIAPLHLRRIRRGLRERLRRRGRA
jgi:hypothetical protein